MSACFDLFHAALLYNEAVKAFEAETSSEGLVLDPAINRAAAFSEEGSGLRVMTYNVDEGTDYLEVTTAENAAAAVERRQRSRA